MATWLVVIFAVELALTRHRGDLPGVAVEREARVLAAVLQFSLILAGYLFLLARQALTGRRFVLERRARTGFLLMGAWASIAVLATLEGFWFGNDLNFILGDFYKFMLLPLLFGLAYFGLRTPGELEWVLKGLVLVLGLFLFYDFLRMTAFLSAGHRFTASSTYYLATFVPLLIYLLFRRRAGVGLRLLTALVLAEALVAVVLLQGLSDYVFFFTGALLFLVFWRKTKLAVLGLVVLGVTLAGIWDVFGLFGGRETYAQTKLQAGLYARTHLEQVEVLAGSRAAEFASVMRSYPGAPEKLLLGFGMGSYLYVEPLSKVWAYWRGWDHFIHSALTETFYRAGLAGLAALLAFLGYLFHRGRQLSAGPQREYGIFLMVNALYQGANLAIQSPLTYPWLILSVSLAGAYVWERQTEGKRREEKPDENRHPVLLVSAAAQGVGGRRSRLRQAVR